jgi:hypothetical protein
MKIVLYACTNLAYDQIFSPVAKTPGVEFTLFSDRHPRFVRGWTWRPLPEQTRGLSDTLVNRYCKFFPHEVLPEADCSIYVDANTLILADLTPLIAEFIDSGADIGLFPHKQRSDIVEELAFGKACGRIPPQDFAKGDAQLKRYFAEGLPPDHVFTENAIIFRRHAAPGLAPAMKLWWEQLEEFTKRDQLSLPYVLHKSELKTKIWDWNYKFENPYFKRYLHRRGFLKDINVLFKNKQHYGRVHHHVFGSLLYAYHGLFKSLKPGREG